MDYNNGKIYTIRSYLTDKFYIGSTTQPLCKRIGEHKGKYNTWKSGGNKIYRSSFEIIKFGDAYIELLEVCACKTKAALNRREGELIRQHKNDVVNIQIAGRSNKEWFVDNKEYVKEQSKEYQNINQETIKQQRHEYHLKNKERLNQIGREFYATHATEIKQYQKEYSNLNHDKIKKRRDEYYKNNREKILQYAREYNIKKKEASQTAETA